MDYAAILLLVGIIIVIVIYYKPKKGDNHNNMRINGQQDRLITEAQEYCDLIYSQQQVPVVSADIILNKNEQAYLCDQVAYFEHRSVTVSTRGGGAIRVAKGVYIGGTKGVSRGEQELKLIDDGFLCITNKRVIFNGTSVTKVYALDKIMGFRTTPDGIWISYDGKEKKPLFRYVKNPYIWVVLLNVLKKVNDGEEIPKCSIERG